MILRTTRLLLIGIFVLSAMPTPASAQQPSASSEATEGDDALAKRFFTLGVELYNRSDYAGALKQFLEAYKYSRKPALLFNIARCHESLGQLEEAIKAFEEYLGSSPENTEQIRARIKNLERRVATKKSAAAEEQRARDAERERLEDQRRKLAAQQKVHEQRDEARLNVHSGSLWKWIVAGSGVALLVGSAILGTLAEARAKDLEEANEAGQNFSAVQNLETRGQNLEKAQIVTAIAGGAAVATGGVLLFIHYTKARERRGAWIAPSVTPTGAQLSGGFSF